MNSTYFLKAAYNELQKHRKQPELDAADFLVFVKEKVKMLELDADLLKRAVNEGFSGGEKKRNEIFKWPCCNRSSPSSMKPIPASTSTR